MATITRSSKVTQEVLDYHPGSSISAGFLVTLQRQRWSALVCPLETWPICWCSKPRTRCSTLSHFYSLENGTCYEVFFSCVLIGFSRDALGGSSSEHGGLLLHGVACHQAPASLRPVLQPQGAQNWQLPQPGGTARSFLLLHIASMCCSWPVCVALCTASVSLF